VSITSSSIVGCLIGGSVGFAACDVVGAERSSSYQREGGDTG
jgi:hypothetical protein